MATTRKEQREQARAERRAREEAAREAQRRKRRIWQLGAVVAAAAVIVIAAIAVSSGGGNGSAGSPTGKATDAALVNQSFSGISESGISVGSQSAPVVVQEFADLQCPFCREYTVSEEPAIVSKYVKTGKVRMELRLLTFIGQDSQAAAAAAYAAAAQNKLWQFTGIWYHNQGAENSGYVTDQFIRKIAASVPGLDTSKLMQERNSPSVTQQITQASSLSTQYGVSSTPTFVVRAKNGQLSKVERSQDLQAALVKAGA